MNKIILKVLFLSIAITVALTSCDTDPTLQSYIVDSGDKEGFITTSIPKTILGIDDNQLSPDSQKAFRSIKKVNVLMYPKTDENTATFEKESKQLSDILDNEDYKLLMTHNSNGMKVKSLYEGDKDSIDEIIVFGTSDQMGMGVARILGDKMNLSSVMKMMKELEKADINPAGMKNILSGMGADLGMDLNNDGKIDPDSTKAIHDLIGIEDIKVDSAEE